jgi:hypothetical protein
MPDAYIVGREWAIGVFLRLGTAVEARVFAILTGTLPLGDS